MLPRLQARTAAESEVSPRVLERVPGHAAAPEQLTDTRIVLSLFIYALSRLNAVSFEDIWKRSAWKAQMWPAPRRAQTHNAELEFV